METRFKMKFHNAKKLNSFLPGVCFVMIMVSMVACAAMYDYLKYKRFSHDLIVHQLISENDLLFNLANHERERNGREELPHWYKTDRKWIRERW